MLRARRRILNLFGFHCDFSLDWRVAGPERLRRQHSGTVASGLRKRPATRQWEDPMSTHSSGGRRESLDVDSTQTMRAVPASELYDSQRPKWYAVQLVISDKPVNLDMMPRLEVFAAHRLYAIAAKHETGTWHALRLGFFPDEQSAEVICGYLQTFFAAPTIVRVSAAEQERFVPTAAPAAPRAALQKPASAPASAPAVQRQEPAQKPVKAAGSQAPSQENQDARRSPARGSARSPAFPQRQEASCGAERIVAHAPAWPKE